MNIYVSHSSNYDYENELYEPIKGPALSRWYAFFLPHEQEHIDVDAVDEASFPATDPGIELG